MPTEFRTSLKPYLFPLSIGFSHTLLAMGSCFAEHLGKKLSSSKFKLQLNPFGILYNPVSLAQGLQRILNGRAYTVQDLFEHQELWHSFDHHGRFSGTDPLLSLQTINDSLHKAQDHLFKSDRLIITLGTAYVFWHIEQQKVVANCHKLPAKLFERKRLTVAQIVAALEPVFIQLKAQQNNLEILLTVSPVRHLRDGHINNQRSKASLLLATEQLEQQFSFVHYYPAYELMLDDLRDYRFYAQDMIHPDEPAVDYIWQHFKESFFSEKTKQLVKHISKINNALSHRAFHPETKGHQTFLRQQIAQMNQLEKTYGFLDFSAEKIQIETQLR